jgi:hypothetical protein
MVPNTSGVFEKSDKIDCSRFVKRNWTWLCESASFDVWEIPTVMAGTTLTKTSWRRALPIKTPVPKG